METLVPNLLEILPSNLLADKKMEAAAKALNVELQRLSADSKLVLHLPRLDELDHDVLDTIAWQFHVDIYEPSTMSLEVKRNLIRQSIFFHRIKGTPEGLRLMLKAFKIDAQAIEWFDYEKVGRPYFFRLKLKDVAYLEDDGDIFMRLIYAAKNERSWLDSFIFDLGEPDLPINLGLIENYVGAEEIDSAKLADTQINLRVGDAVQDVSRADYQIESQPAMQSGDLKLGQVYQSWNYDEILAEYEEEIIPEPKPEPADEIPLGDSLSLYFKFLDNRYKIFYVPNPTEPVDREGIKRLSAYSVHNKVLRNRYGSLTSGIAHAALIRQTERTLK